MTCIHYRVLTSSTTLSWVRTSSFHFFEWHWIIVFINITICYACHFRHVDIQAKSHFLCLLTSYHFSWLRVSGFRSRLAVVRGTELGRFGSGGWRTSSCRSFYSRTRCVSLHYRCWLGIQNRPSEIRFTRLHRKRKKEIFYKNWISNVIFHFSRIDIQEVILWVGAVRPITWCKSL